MKRTRQSQATTPAGSSQLVPWLLFILLLGGGLGFYVYHEVQRASSEHLAIARRQKANEELGLPRDYPSDVTPLYPGVTLTTATRGESKATDGRPMDQWKVHAESDESKDVIFKYYNQLMLDKGFQQTLYASVPNGYSVNFANESSEIVFTIEKKHNDKRTQLDITFSRIQPGAPPAKPETSQDSGASAPIMIKPGKPSPGAGKAVPSSPPTPGAPPAKPGG